MQGEVLVAVITCPGELCEAEFEGTWLAPDDSDEPPENAMQLCPECGRGFDAEWPGFSFRTEA
jgi:hypothetical protein